MAATANPISRATTCTTSSLLLPARANSVEISALAVFASTFGESFSDSGSRSLALRPIRSRSKLSAMDFESSDIGSSAFCWV